MVLCWWWCWWCCVDGVVLVVDGKSEVMLLRQRP